jgi:hypothetical protein
MVPDSASKDSASKDGASKDGADGDSAASDGAPSNGAASDGAASEGAASPPVCSSRGCRREAAWMLLWRNPRIHGSDRVKRWAACDEHLPVLREYLTVRGFPCAVEGLPPSGTVQ